MPNEKQPDEPSFQEWKDRFRKLQYEAEEYGIASVVLITSGDPLNRKEAFSQEIVGGRIRAVGMLQQTLMNLQNADMRDA